MLPFRSGAFRLAIETGRPVQPLAVSGTRDAIRADSLVFGRARVTLRILPQVPTAGLGEEDLDDLSDRVRAIIEAARVRQAPDSDT
jgi:1-acyl-sn-glycerol-3-phosphate acyltransferase